MMLLTLERLPGGDATRRSTIATISLTNTGDGIAGVRVYSARLVDAEEKARAEVTRAPCLTHREVDEGALRLAHRALGELLGLND